MFDRFRLGAILLAGLVVVYTGCNSSSSGLDAIQVSPAS